MNNWQHFKLEYDSEWSQKYPSGYWAGVTSTGYDATGKTPLEVVTRLVIQLDKARAG